MKRSKGAICLTLALSLGMAFSFTGCDSSKNTLPQSSNDGTEDTTESVMTEPGETENVPDSTEIPDTSTDSSEPTETPPIIDIVPSTEMPTETETAGPTDARLETVNTYYNVNSISLSYPQIIGLKDDESQEYANNALKEHALSIIEYYVKDEENDFLELSYEVTTLYRGQISVIYTGTYRGANDEDVTHLRMTDNINLIDDMNIRLSNRISKDNLKKIIFETGDYEIVSDYKGNRAALEEYLESQPAEFYEQLVANADFGGTDYPTGFSYNQGDRVTILIPLPHLLGDYVEIAIIQKSK